MINRSLFVSAAAVLLMTGASASVLAADSVSSAVQAAVADAARPDADRQRDANRKPGELIAFAGIKAGDKVSDMLPGGGYFTRLFSKVVGPKGVVYALAPAPRPDAPAGAPDPAAAVKKIAEDPAYANVKVGQITANPPEKVDVAWTSLNYHDLHNRPNADLAAFNKQVFDMLKPGGTYIVIDHAAAKGTGKSSTSTLHRIDPDFVKSEVVAAGFKFDGESKALANPDDPGTAPNRDSNVQGRTNQFVFKFRKPS
ncbi:MAG: methyltransferase [Steroidobacteraceae bacterium]